jgi:hypothetical protein
MAIDTVVGACPEGRTVSRFAGEAFGASNDRPPSRGRVLFPSVKRGGTAAPDRDGFVRTYRSMVRSLPG